MRPLALFISRRRRTPPPARYVLDEEWEWVYGRKEAARARDSEVSGTEAAPEPDSSTERTFDWNGLSPHHH